MATVLRPGSTRENSLETEGSKNAVHVYKERRMTSSSSRKRTKRDVFDRYLQYLRDCTNIDVDEQGFIDSLWKHFELLPTRYFLDVNIYGTEILEHKELLERARQNPNSVAFRIRDVEAYFPKLVESSISKEGSGGIVLSQSNELPTSVLSGRIQTTSGLGAGLKPSFPSSSSLHNLIGELSDYPTTDDIPDDMELIIIKEIIVAAKDKPQLLSRVSNALSAAGLNIREAHAFNAHDGFSFDVFVVNSNLDVTSGELDKLLEEEFRDMLIEKRKEDSYFSSLSQLERAASTQIMTDDWEIAIDQVHLQSRIATSTFGHVYKGEYYGQIVAVKIIKDAMDNEQQYRDFIHEVSIMKKVRHRNIVQFIGARTERPNLCILFEYMDKGSIHDHLKEQGPLRLLEIYRIALDVANGMDHLHRRNIIHRDLKSANLLVDSTGTVKIADFGVARVLEAVCCATAETGTYRWMAPEVIEHKPYDNKVDVYSFGILLWELLTAEIPYNGMTPLQAAVAVVQRNLRPSIPDHCPIHLAHLMNACWSRSPSSRPGFIEIRQSLIEALETEKQAADISKSSSSLSRVSLFSKLRRAGANYQR